MNIEIGGRKFLFFTCFFPIHPPSKMKAIVWFYPLSKQIERKPRRLGIRFLPHSYAFYARSLPRMILKKKAVAHFSQLPVNLLLVLKQDINDLSDSAASG